MTPTYLNSSPSPYPLALGDDHYHHVYNPQASSSSSSPPPPSQVLTYSFQDQGVVNYPREVHQLKYQQDQGNFLASQGENDHGGLKFWIPKKEDESKDEIDHKWMPPKLRLIRKMKNADQARVEAPISPQPVKLEDEKQASSSTEIDGSNNSPIRVCSDCNTTKTPLWRSGPRGPKSLCNACGIRQRKARRAMAAAAAAAAVSGADLPEETLPGIKTKVVHHKKKRSNTNVNGHNAQHHKRRPKLLASTTTTTNTSSIQSQGKKHLCFEEFLMSLNKSLAIHQVFPQDEKEAAILLMALSCHDLVHG